MKLVKLFAVVALLFSASALHAQKLMTPPTVLIVPDMIYCKAHGFTQQFDNMGVNEEIPDYERAVTEDPTLYDVLHKIGQLIKERNSDIVVLDLLECINLAKTDAAMSTANGGDVSESIEEAIIRNSNADILVKVQYDLLKQGPRYRVSYTLNGVDSYTGNNFAPVQGIGPNSTDSNPVVLLSEAVIEHMDSFLDKMTSFYNNMATKGRMVAFDFKITGSSPWTMNSSLGDGTLQEIIDDILYDNSVDGGGLERVKGGSTFLQYQGVYIPLISTIRGRQRRQGAKDVAQKVVQQLAGRGVDADYKIVGLGKVNVFIR